MASAPRGTVGAWRAALAELDPLGERGLGSSLTVTVAYLPGTVLELSLVGSNLRRPGCLLGQGEVMLDGLDGAADPVLGLDAAAEGCRTGTHGWVADGRVDGGGQAVHGHGRAGRPAAHGCPSPSSCPHRPRARLQVRGDG
jgi:hypothetical protein